MYDMLKRDIKAGDLLLVELKNDTIVLTTGSYMLYVGEGIAYDGRTCKKITKSAYIIENPVKRELEIKADLSRRFREYQKKQMETKRMTRKELSAIKDAQLSPGDIFVRGNSNSVWVYLGITALYYETIPYNCSESSFSGYTYIKLEVCQYAAEGQISCLNGRLCTFTEYCNMDSHHRYLRNKCNEIYKLGTDDFPVIENCGSIIVTKEPSKKFVTKIGHINLDQQDFYGYLMDSKNYGCTVYHKFNMYFVKED